MIRAMTLALALTSSACALFGGGSSSGSLQGKSPTELLPPGEVSITPIEETTDVHETQVVLENLLKTYDLTPYLFTKRIQIRSGVVPHSHPVMTLSTSFRDDRESFLLSFLHLQIHWFLSLKPDETLKAIDELRKLYPVLPAEKRENGIIPDTSYMHVMIGWLELRAAKRYFPEQRAYALIKTRPIYRYTYDVIFKNEPEIGAILGKYGLAI